MMDIVVVADLGAAGNLVRNLLLLSEQTDWPLATNRLDTISKQYQSDLTKWLEIEYRLRFWDRYYNVDISNDINLVKFYQRKITNRPVVYLNHSAFYQDEKYQQLAPQVSTIYVAPKTDFGLRWQIRSYCEKKTVERLHNFTFDSDVDAQRDRYCREHGQEAYYKLNVKNFQEIVATRQQEFGPPDIPLELLLSGSVTAIASALNCVSLDLTQVEQIITAWRQCHWPLNETDNWKYYD